MKGCTHCKVIKELTDFPLLKRAIDGRGSWCKSCLAAQVKKYNGTANGRAVRAHWLTQNKERLSQYRRTYYVLTKKRNAHARRLKNRRRAKTQSENHCFAEMRERVEAMLNAMNPDQMTKQSERANKINFVVCVGEHSYQIILMKREKNNEKPT